MACKECERLEKECDRLGAGYDALEDERDGLQSQFIDYRATLQAVLRRVAGLDEVPMGRAPGGLQYDVERIVRDGLGLFAQEIMG